MAKEFKKWIDEFVENGANPKNVVNWPEEASGGSGTRVVNELPQVGEEHIIYELQEKKKIPSLIPSVNQQMVNDGVFNELALFVFVFDTREDMTNAFTSVVPEEENPFYINYIIKEDKLIMSGYVDAGWQFAEVTKVSDYKFDLSSVFGGESSTYLVMIKEYLGKSSEESGDIRYTGKLLNDELYTFESDAFGVLLGAPTSGIMVFNYRYELEGMPEVPEEYTFEYIPYEKIIKNQLASLREGLNVLWVFKSNGTSEGIASSYWIYANETWFNADEIREFEFQEKTVSPSTNAQQITPDDGYDGLSKVTVNALNLQDKAVSPTASMQYVTPDANFTGLRQVEVSAVTSAIDSNIKAENIKKGVAILGVSGDLDCVTYKTTELSATLPQALADIDVATVGSNIYLFGGVKSDYKSSNTIYKFNNETKAITTLSATLPQALAGIDVATVGSNIYLFGGTSSGGNTINPIYKFNTETEAITELSATLPQALSNISAGQVGSDIYLFGGAISGGNTINTIYKFNTETETISTLSVTLPESLYNIGVAQVGSNVYLFGGIKSGSKYSITIYKFNTETETITELSATLPQGLINIDVATVGSNIYLFGGMNISGKVNPIYKFNTETEAITELSATLPQALSDISAGQVGSDIYFFGGVSSSNIVNTIYKFSVDF